MTCYFLLFWFILTLHDRTGRLESPWRAVLPKCRLHDRTGRLENQLIKLPLSAFLHDRTGRLEKNYYKIFGS